MNNAELIAARKEFTKSFPPLEDDQKAPKFYSSVKEKFFPESDKSNKIAFIVVAHSVHTLPYFLEGLSYQGEIAALIPKGSLTVPHVRKEIDKIYAPIIKQDINKRILHDNDKAKAFLESVISDSKWKDYQFIIVDHGGYFAPIICSVLPHYKSRIRGIVEHTWNGELRYLENGNEFKLPIRSIARSELKEKEDLAVAESIVIALLGEVLSGKGLNQSLKSLRKIALFGYGHIGSQIANLLSNFLNRGGPDIYICDTDSEKLEKAKTDLSNTGVKIVTTLKKSECLDNADLIIVVTSKPVLTKEDFSKHIKDKACIVCGTSSDDLFENNALDDFEECNHDTQSQLKLPIQWYRQKQNQNRMIALAANGGSINYLIGSTPQPIIHAVLASVCISVAQLIKAHFEQDSYQLMQADNNQDKLMMNQCWYNYFNDAQQEPGINVFINTLSILYREQLTMPLLISSNTGKPNTIENHYVDLLIQRITDEESGKITEKLKINYDGLLKNTSPTPSVIRQLIVAPTGYGKTTLLKYIVSNFIQHKLPQFKIVFWVPLRKLALQINNIHSIEDVIYYSFLHFEKELELSRENLKDIIKKILAAYSVHSILFLCDSWEEFLSAYEGGTEEEKERKKRAFSRIFSNYNVIVTSRPNVNLQFPIDRHLVIEGFEGEEQVTKYVEKFFHETKIDYNELLTNLKHKSFNNIPNIPIILEMLCSLWKHSGYCQDFKQLTTITPIYKKIFETLLRRFLKEKLKPFEDNKIDQLSFDDFFKNPKCGSVIKCQLFIAFKMLTEGEQVVIGTKLAGYINEYFSLFSSKDGQDNQELSMKELLRALGFMKSNTYHNTFDDNIYELLHPSLLEFLAALYYTYLEKPPTEKQNCDANLKKLPNKINQANFWRFLTGLLKDKHDQLKTIFDLICEDTSDLFGAAGLMLTINCFSECLPVQKLTDLIENNEREKAIELIPKPLMLTWNSVISKLRLLLNSNIPIEIESNLSIPKYIMQQAITSLDFCLLIPPINKKATIYEMDEDKCDQLYLKAKSLIELHQRRDNSNAISQLPDPQKCDVLWKVLTANQHLLDKPEKFATSSDQACCCNACLDNIDVDEIYLMTRDAKKIEQADKLLQLIDFEIMPCCLYMRLFRFMVLNNNINALCNILSSLDNMLDTKPIEQNIKYYADFHYFIEKPKLKLHIIKAITRLMDDEGHTKRGISALISAQEATPNSKKTDVSSHIANTLSNFSLVQFIEKLNYESWLKLFETDPNSVKSFRFTSPNIIINMYAHAPLNTPKRMFFMNVLVFLIYSKCIAVYEKDNMINFQIENGSYGPNCYAVDKNLIDLPTMLNHAKRYNNQSTTTSWWSYFCSFFSNSNNRLPVPIAVPNTGSLAEPPKLAS